MLIAKITPEILWCGIIIVLLADSISTEAIADDAICMGETVLRMQQAQWPSELVGCIDELFSGTTTEELNLLIASPHCDVALASGWERVRRTTPNERQLSRFLRLVEERTQFPIPKAWASSVESATGRSQQRLSFTLPDFGKKPTEASEGASTFAVPLDWQADRRDDQWIVKVGKESLMLPVDKGFGPVHMATVLMNSGTTYVALHTSGFPLSFFLYAVQQDNKKVLWSTKVWAGGGASRIYMGQGRHLVELKLVGDKLAVFGVAGNAVYVEVFETRSGKNDYRFSTAYFGIHR